MADFLCVYTNLKKINLRSLVWAAITALYDTNLTACLPASYNCISV